MRHRSLAALLVAAVLLGAAAPPVPAGGTEDSSLRRTVKADLQAQGYDTTNFGSLTLGEVVLIRSLLENDLELPMRRKIELLLADD